MNALLTASELSYPSQSLASMRGRLQSAWQRAEEFISSDIRDGHLTGELSTSALSTATAISALSLCEEQNTLQVVYGDTGRQAIAVGCAWLAAHQNSDGGFGDTNRSHSNIATSLLVQAAWKLAKFEPDRVQRDRLQQYIASQNSWDGLRRRYGKDKTFVVPILTNCALAGIAQWKQVPALPFEAAWLPQSWYRLARMPVVSYAVPALVAIGQVKFHFQPPLNPFVRALRHQAIEPTLRVLRSMQPDSGGYLEAVPLTSFVLMSLAGVGKLDLQVARDCIRFIMDSRLSDGSWPIDTNLATWVTSLSVVARRRRTRTPLLLASENQRADSSLDLARPTESAGSPTAISSSPWITPQTLRWLLKCQHLRRHPFTGARPGGWAGRI